ncbi:MAG: methyltransferase [Candidatus Aminicenantes bacterium]|nr:methyltransferase [Candidatus Aminicenantes bacterium]
MESEVEGIGCRDIVDLFCGVGLMSLFVADTNMAVVGVETDSHAVESAEKNSRRMGIGSARFDCTSVERALPDLEFHTDSLVIINPP